MSARAHALPGTATGGPRFDRDRLRRSLATWWDGWLEILRAACPVVIVPSPAREAFIARGIPAPLDQTVAW